MRLVLCAGLALFSLARPASPQTCIPPLDGLRIWWDADDIKWDPADPWHFREGPHAFDSTNRIDGPFLHVENHDPNWGPWVPQFAPGMVGQAFSFDPAHPKRSNLVMFSPGPVPPTQHPETEFTTELSIELWMKWNPSAYYSNSTFGLVDKSLHQDYYPTDVGFALSGETSSGRLYFRLGKGGGQAVDAWGTTNVKDGAWHHVVATFDASLPSGNQRIYVDGVLEGSADNSSPIAASDRRIAIGRSPYYGSYVGLIDEIMLYGRALTAEEVDLGYHTPARCRPTFPTRPNPSGYIEFPSTYPHSNDMDLDGDVLAVTDPYDGTRVFRRSGASWAEEQFLVPAVDPNTYEGAYPWVCAVSGDVLVQTTFHGASVWRFDGTSWVEEQFLSAHGIGGAGGWSHPSVDISGDTIVVGGNTYARVFRHDGSQWIQEAVLSGSGEFGLPVAIDGDFLAVGAHRADNVGTRSGALHLFRRTGTTWNQVALVTADQLEPGRASYDYFSLGRQLDVDGERVLVGAMGAVQPDLTDYDWKWIGSAYVLDASGGSVTLEGKLPASLHARSFAGWSHGRGGAPGGESRGRRRLQRRVRSPPGERQRLGARLRAPERRLARGRQVPC